jgi:hypothetical protein
MALGFHSHTWTNGKGGGGEEQWRSDRDERHRTGREEGCSCQRGRAVVVDEGFLGVGRWNEDKCHRSSILS